MHQTFNCYEKEIVPGGRDSGNDFGCSSFKWTKMSCPNRSHQKLLEMTMKPEKNLIGGRRWSGDNVLEIMQVGYDGVGNESCKGATEDTFFISVFISQSQFMKQEAVPKNDANFQK